LSKTDCPSILPTGCGKASEGKIYYMNIDRFDMVVNVAILFLVASTVYYGYAENSVASVKPASATVSSSSSEPDIFPKISQAKAMIEAGQAKEAIGLLKTIAGRSPVLAEPHALLGQAYSRVFDYNSSIKEYRLALQIDPDYVDKKSDKYIGKRIAAAVKECKAQSNSTLRNKPSDLDARSALNDVSYIERMLAGGCN